MTTQVSASQLKRVMTTINYIQDDANTLDECRGMVVWCEVGTPSSTGAVLLRLRTRLAFVMQLVVEGLTDPVFDYICLIHCT